MKKLLSVTFFSGILTLVKMASGFVIAKVVAVYAGPAGMAMLGQIQNIATSLNGIVNAPVGSGIVRYTAENHNKGIEYCSAWWKASFRWVIIFLTIIIPICFLFSTELSEWLLNDPTYNWIIQLIAIFLPLTAIGTFINSVINGQQQYKRFVIMGMCSVVISTLIMVFCIIQYEIKGALVAASIQSGLIGIVMIIGTLRQPWFKLSFLFGSTEKENRKKIGGYILMAITSAIMMPLSLVMVRNIIIDNVGWDGAGQWQAVWKISEAYLAVITISLGTYFLPKLSTLNRIEDIKKEINQTIKIVIPIVIAMSLAVYLLRDIIINLLFTKQFHEARELFAIQLIGDVVKITSWIYAYPMLSRGATKWFVCLEIIFSITFVILTWFLIPCFSVKGANIAYVINYLFYFLMVYLNMSKFWR
ncbi:O-antigen translocase [Orbaceae bacterium ac157xtp]